jgi:hypothetical protein
MYVCMSMYVCMYVCMDVCMSVRTWILWMYGCMDVWMYVWMCMYGCCMSMYLCVECVGGSDAVNTAMWSPRWIWATRWRSYNRKRRGRSTPSSWLKRMPMVTRCAALAILSCPVHVVVCVSPSCLLAIALCPCPVHVVVCVSPSCLLAIALCPCPTRHSLTRAFHHFPHAAPHPLYHHPTRRSAGGCHSANAAAVGARLYCGAYSCCHQQQAIFAHPGTSATR